LIANQQREDLPTTTLAKGVFDLMEVKKCSAKEAASLIGLSTKVGKLTRMMRLPNEILEQIDAGKIPGSCGYYLSRLDDKDKQVELANQIIAGTLTRDALQRVVATMLPKKVSKGKSTLRKATICLDGGFTVSVSAPGLHLTSLISILEITLKRAKQEHRKGLCLETFVNMLRDQCRTTKK
jgi:hypothetical protein